MKLKKKLFMLMPFAAALTIAAPLIITSCSTSQSSDGSNSGSQNGGIVKPDFKPGEVNKKTFNPKKQTIFRNTTTSNNIFILDPNLNDDAQKKAIDSFKEAFPSNENGVKAMQKDFTNVLSKFYEIYEFNYEKDNGTSEVEIEAEIQNIKVDNVKFEDNKIKVGLKVTYMVEKEVESKDGDNKTKEEETQDKTATLVPKFATSVEIKKITNLLEELKNKDSSVEGQKFEIDVEDLYELYVGNKDDNEKSIFEQVEAFQTEKDSKYGGLLGYGIKISDLMYEDNKTNSRNKNTSNSSIINEEIFAPSSIVKDFFTPEVTQPEVTQPEVPEQGAPQPQENINIELNLENLKQGTLEQWETFFNHPLAGNENPENKKDKDKIVEAIVLNPENVKNSIKNVAFKKALENETMHSITFDVFVDKNKPNGQTYQIVLGIDPTWLKPSSQPNGNEGGQSGGNNQAENGQDQSQQNNNQGTSK